MALQGTIDSFPIADVLQLLGASSKTGRLDIDGDRGRGSLWVDDGTIVSGDIEGVPTTTAADVVFEFFLFTEGSFEFVTGDSPSGHAFSASTAEAVERATSMLADWEQIRLVVPDTAHTVALNPSLEQSEVTVSADEWALLVACGVEPTVESLLGALEVGEFEGCSRIAELADRALVLIGEPLAAHSVSDEIDADSAVEAVPPERSAPAFASVDIDRSEVPADPVSPAARFGGMDTGMDTSFTDDDGTVASEAFPDHFPIDDLVGSEESVSFDNVAGAGTGTDAFSDVPAPTPSPFESTAFENTAFENTAFENTAFENTAFDAGGAFSPDGDDNVHEAARESGADNVLAQIGRLSPKAAEAIAAALGDGEEG